MRTDLYTKVTLTVIAVCLVWISLGGPSLLTTVSAQQSRTSGYQRVIIAGWVNEAGTEQKLAAGLPVSVTNTR